MSKSARLVILSAIIAGTEIEDIVKSVKAECNVSKDDAAIKKDINWYRSYAKKEELVDAEGFATEKGEEWIKNGGKKPVSPEVLAKREAAAKAKAEKAAERKAKAEAKAKEKAEAAALKKESKSAVAKDTTPTTKTANATAPKAAKPRAAAPKKPAAVAAAQAKAAQAKAAS